MPPLGNSLYAYMVQRALVDKQQQLAREQMAQEQGMFKDRMASELRHDLIARDRVDTQERENEFRRAFDIAKMKGAIAKSRGEELPEFDDPRLLEGAELGAGVREIEDRERAAAAGLERYKADQTLHAKLAAVEQRDRLLGFLGDKTAAQLDSEAQNRLLEEKRINMMGDYYKNRLHMDQAQLADKSAALLNDQISSAEAVAKQEIESYSIANQEKAAKASALANDLAQLKATAIGAKWKPATLAKAMAQVFVAHGITSKIPAALSSSGNVALDVPPPESSRGARPPIDDVTRGLAEQAIKDLEAEIGQ